MGQYLAPQRSTNFSEVLGIVELDERVENGA